MPLFVTIFMLFSIPLLVYFKQYKALFVFGLLSYFTDFFFIYFGTFRFWAAGYIALWLMVSKRKVFVFDKAIIGRLLWFEWFIMLFVGSYFVFIEPWSDPYEKYRLVTQQLPMRTFVGMIRFAEVIFSFYFFYYIFKKKYVDLDYFVRATFYIGLVTFIVGLVDYLFLKGSIRLLFIPGHYALTRFTGMMGEPRGVGQIMGLSIFLFISLGFRNPRLNRYSVIGMIISFISIGLSFSSTAIAYTSVVLLAFILLGRLKIKYVFLIIFIYFISFFVLIKNDKFVEHQNSRIMEVGLEMTISQIPGVPPIINRFEVFDRTALAFLYFHPNNIWLGVGPNTITVPASEYLSDLDRDIYEGQINTTPFNGIITIGSRSGIVGLVLHLIGFMNIFYLIYRCKDRHLMNLLILNSVYFILYHNLLSIMITGIICGILIGYKNSQTNKLEYS